MVYCTLDDIYGSIDAQDVIDYTDDEDTGAVNMIRVDQAIAGAGALIDSHMGGRYVVPLNPVPDMILELAVDIAIYKIASRRGKAPEGRREKFDDAVKLLEKIAAGKAVVPGAASAATESGNHPVKITSAGKVFSRESLKGW